MSYFFKVADRIKYNYKLQAAAIVVISFIFCFKSLSTPPLSDWDETRYGMIAWNMMVRHDFLNYFFLYGYDITVTKPPLGIYAICASYKIFGFNEFALRLPSAIAGFLFFMIFYRWCRKELNAPAAFIIVLILLGVKGLVGWHVFRTGDLDGMFTLFITLANIQFYYFVKTSKEKFAFFMMVFLSLAYYTKGFTFILFTPGWLLYLVLNRKVYLLWNIKTLFTFVVFIAIVASWPVIHGLCSTKFNDNELHYTNFFQRMWKYDIMERYFSGLGENNKSNFSRQSDYQYLIANPDSSYNLWNYFLYAMVILHIYLVRKKRIVNDLFKNDLFKYAVISAVLPLLIISFSQTKLGWYTCSLIPFYGIITYMLYQKNKVVTNISRPLNITIAILLIFCLVRNAIQLQLPEFKPALSETLKKKYAGNDGLLILPSYARETVYLYGAWLAGGNFRICVPVDTARHTQPVLYYKDGIPDLIIPVH